MTRETPFVKLSVVGVRAMARNTHRAGVRESTVGLYSARQESADAIQRIRERLSASRAAEPPALEQLTVEASGLYHMLEGMLDRGEVLAQSRYNPYALTAKFAHCLPSVPRYLLHSLNHSFCCWAKQSFTGCGTPRLQIPECTEPRELPSSLQPVSFLRLLLLPL